MITCLLVLTVIALLLAPALLKQNPQQLAVVRVGLCLVALTLVFLRLTICSNAPLSIGEKTYNRYWTVGWKLGALLAAEYPDAGRVHVFQAAPRSAGMKTMNKSVLAGLEAGAGKVRFEFVLRNPASPNPDDMAGSGDGELSMEDCLKECEGARALVSFVNLPLDNDPSYQLPKAYVMDDFSTGYWIPAMREGRVGAAVTPHLDPSDVDFAKEKGRPEERFDAIFRLFTPETVDTFDTAGTR